MFKSTQSCILPPLEFGVDDLEIKAPEPGAATLELVALFVIAGLSAHRSTRAATHPSMHSSANRVA